jgi:hypothetical protein
LHMWLTCVFPEGLLMDIPQRQYLTSKVNGVFSLIKGLSKVVEGVKKDDPGFFLNRPTQ